jgi:hypothetical protein
MALLLNSPDQIICLTEPDETGKAIEEGEIPF